MEAHPSLLILLLLSCFATASYAEHNDHTEHNVHLSALNQSLIVSTSSTPGQVLKAGVDQVTITWSYNQSFPAGTDTNYTTVEAMLCYAPVSQTGRDDRKTDDNLDNDKTCPLVITEAPYKRSNNSFVWTIPRDTPTATYFVRVYAVYNEHEKGYGESTDALKTTSLFQVDGIVSEEKVSGAWSMVGNSFGYGYAWLLMLFLLYI
ncbi:unnamed protein product [Lactuca saligna]|uniref:High-affinity nitrate transporter n=1 Tax=Lactuca saligna TaxID=75948 RepID=A0AA35YUK9_LACSI|nr:unnamed protein product [Lactuca saligna]